ncbi:30S ribosomal protein S16 [candidate division WWE3 bacterium RIFCSPHIGHO2_12_FULL_38_15]|uniref:Small ribosomal subunit protein bS16 n=1 Tax=candidate division WWE3 bacterium RIFCSPHIGHO2_02_FULL_38_14 TaxID=1802620 RepID=A0A1F4V6F6_UNCKA|nr:MAG: 30S ribosomal protein S16 [candidate division WWE3 bacterium RIFCSPHIGHO2_01_FULL_38_45]OGC48816.1 MAG: 30S ribosomal protein S16 [candidate division WWE3 bacterium RIFCSPHIGHO2_12_FULL_38_15]OGC52771.1 MAG: 30S ribosomal protein S16 [candidate division WWE3 bacterium RIFCSPHIGHO2_02_FULL_38_14]OGC53118.1 MAG: 30S ribosomal protein S16 [candidate division WWE3 bacterium RIFCSPLOWO2_01_FULL_37_24]HLB51957.1 30S ribosomal protein S16 [Patescibacteria group bacterium]
MSVSIRLAKFGKKNAPTYKVVVANTKDKRNGRFIEVLGFYNPHQKTDSFSVNKQKYEEWQKKGALTTPAVEKLVSGKYNYTKYNPKAKKVEASTEV